MFHESRHWFDNRFESPFLVAPGEFFLTGISPNNLYNGIIDIMQASGEFCRKTVEGLLIPWTLLALVPLAVFCIFASERVRFTSVLCESGNSPFHIRRTSWMHGAFGRRIQILCLSSRIMTLLYRGQRTRQKSTKPRQRPQLLCRRRFNKYSKVECAMGTGLFPR